MILPLWMLVLITLSGGSWLWALVLHSLDYAGWVQSKNHMLTEELACNVSSGRIALHELQIKLHARRLLLAIFFGWSYVFLIIPKMSFRLIKQAKLEEVIKLRSGKHEISPGHLSVVESQGGELSKVERT